MGKGINTTADEGQTAIVYRKSKRAQTEEDDESWIEADVSNTLNTFDQGDARATELVLGFVPEVADPLVASEERTQSHAGNNPRARNVVAAPTFALDEYNQAGHEEVCFPLRTAQGDGIPKVNLPNMAVRRLTPRECERLQGFPDDYTAIPRSTGKPASDGPRYKALGNSMAVYVMRWIGRRIQSVASAATN